jgi:hypothetical protein
MKYESILLIKFSLTRVPEQGERSKGSNAQLIASRASTAFQCIFNSCTCAVVANPRRPSIASRNYSGYGVLVQI